MIRELSELGKKIREKESDNKITHDALKDEPISIDLIIKEDGSFERFDVIEKISRRAEAITAKKGKARLLLDKAEEVLCYFESAPADKKENEKRKKASKFKHDLFIDKLEKYRELSELKPVFLFYEKYKSKGIDKAVSCFEDEVKDKERGGNIAFRIKGKSIRIHEEPSVYKNIIEKYKNDQSSRMQKESKTCSVCGKNKYPVVDIPHGMIKRVPDGQTSGCALVSYNENAFESYELIGNNNSSICTNCAKTYVEGLNWLLGNGNNIIVTDKKGKEKSIFKFTNRKNFGSDTAMVFWTRKNQNVKEIDFLDVPDEGEVAVLIDSVTSGKNKPADNISTDQFYSCSLSGAAARIAVRDWIELSLEDCRRKIAEWFIDIAIEAYGKIQYSPIYFLARAGQNTKSKNDTTIDRAAAYLWNAALKGTAPPIWILAAVLKRLRYIEPVDEGKKSKDPITPERAALIKLILNRNNKNKGGYIMLQEQFDPANKSAAYVCGHVFAVMESIQRAAQGKDLNAGIRERFFSFASTNPSPAFGRLMKLSQNHITKLKHEKSGVAVILDRQLRELCSNINEFPAVFSLEEQGQFALGYYHQKQKDYNEYKKHEELKQLTEEE